MSAAKRRWSFRTRLTSLIAVVFVAGGVGLLGVQYLLVLPMAVVCGLVLKLPFLTTYLLVMLVEDLAKVSLSLIHYFRMTWIRPVAGLYEAEAGYFESCK